MLKRLFLSPHPDDETLFGAYIIQIGNPLVAIFNNEVERINESREAMKILGAEMVVINDITELPKDFDIVYAPAMQGGHPFHDQVCRQAIRYFGENVFFYATYERENLTPYGRFQVGPVTEEMKLKKLEALNCYKSQLEKTPIHFQIKSKDEYYF